MKKLLPLAVIAVVFLSFGNLHAEKKLRRYLELEGKIFETGFDLKGTQHYMDSALIVVQDLESGINDTLYSAESGSYIFRLPLNRDYLVTISKSGFVSKKLAVNTHVPVFSTGYYGIEFELDLYKSIPGLDVSPLLDQPVADIAFNHKKKTFDYDHAYTDQVNRQLKKIYTAYYQHRTVPVVKVKKNNAVKSVAAKKVRGNKALRVSSGKIRR